MNTMSLGTELSIYEVAVMQSSLNEALREAEAVAIDCANLRTFDGAGLQWMLSVNQSHVPSRVQWVNLSEAVNERLAHLGVSLGQSSSERGAA